MGLKSSHSFYQKQQDQLYYIIQLLQLSPSKRREVSQWKSDVDVGGDSTINKVKFVPHNLLQQGTSCTNHPYGGRMVAERWHGTVSTSPASPPSGISTTNENTGNIYIQTYQAKPTYHTDTQLTTYNKENYKFTSGLGTLAIFVFYYTFSTQIKYMRIFPLLHIYWCLIPRN